MNIGSGLMDFEKGINYAPPKDSSGAVIQSPFLDSKEIDGDHIYVVVDRWEARPETRDREKMERLIQKLEEWKVSDPRVLVDPKTASAIDQLVDKIKNLLLIMPPEKSISQERGSGARNFFEKALVQWGFPAKYDEYLTRYYFSDSNGKEDEDKIKMGKKVKKSFLLTRIFRALIDPIDWSTPTLKDPSSAFSYVDKATSMNIKQVLETIDNGVSDEDRLIAQEFQKDMLSTVAVLGELIQTFSQIKASAGEMRTQQLAAKMREIYQNFLTFGTIDRLQIFHGLPELMDDEGNLSKESLGNILFYGVKEAISRGHDWVTDSSTGWVRERQYAWRPNVPDKKGKNAAIFRFKSTGERILVTLFSPMFKGVNFGTDPKLAIKSANSLFPENEAGASSNEKTPALENLREACARLAQDGKLSPPTPSKISPTSELSGNIAGALTYQLLVVWGEADAQDMVWSSERERGSPVGWSYLARVENSGLYAQKTSDKDSVDSKTNPYIVGRMHKAGVPYTKFLATKEGKTLEQAILTSKKETWEEVYKQMDGYITTRASLAFSNHMVRAITEYEKAESILEGGIFDIATINLQEGQVKIKNDVIKQLFDRIRNALEYHEGADLVASGILADTKPITDAFDKDSQSQEFKERKLPSEEFYEIIVVDANCHIDDGIRVEPNNNKYDYEHHVVKHPKIKLAGRYITRFPSHYVVDPLLLATWLDGDRDREYKNAVGFTRPVLKYDATSGQYFETGQKDKIILIQLRDDKVDVKRNDAKKLMQRLHVEYILEMAGLPSDAISKLKKEDWLPLGLFFSAEIREKYLRGEYGTPTDRIRGLIAETFKSVTGRELEFIAREDPGVLGRDLFSESQFIELLALLGHRITLEDWKNTINTFGALVGLPKIEGKPGKH